MELGRSPKLKDRGGATEIRESDESRNGIGGVNLRNSRIVEEQRKVSSGVSLKFRRNRRERGALTLMV